MTDVTTIGVIMTITTTETTIGVAKTITTEADVMTTTEIMLLVPVLRVPKPVHHSPETPVVVVMMHHLLEVQTKVLDAISKVVRRRKRMRRTMRTNQKVLFV
jgi:hypothetical protein